MVLVDSNVLVDVFAASGEWRSWSTRAMAEAGSREGLAINPVIYAELGAAFASESELDRFLPTTRFARLELPYSAAWLAGHAFVRYRRSGGTRRSPLPDFYIGAHAQVAGLTLLTRDAGRYRSYFPKVRLIAPEN